MTFRWHAGRLPGREPRNALGSCGGDRTIDRTI
jgi:hypothetical protein